MATSEEPFEESVAFNDLRRRVSFTAKTVLKALSEDATDEGDRDLARSAAHAIWTVGMSLTGIYQELNEIKHELRRLNESRDARG